MQFQPFPHMTGTDKDGLEVQMWFYQNVLALFGATIDKTSKALLFVNREVLPELKELLSDMAKSEDPRLTLCEGIKSMHYEVADRLRELEGMGVITSEETRECMQKLDLYLRHPSSVENGLAQWTCMCSLKYSLDDIIRDPQKQTRETVMEAVRGACQTRDRVQRHMKDLVPPDLYKVIADKLGELLRKAQTKTRKREDRGMER